MIRVTKKQSSREMPCHKYFMLWNSENKEEVNDYLIICCITRYMYKLFKIFEKEVFSKSLNIYYNYIHNYYIHVVCMRIAK